MVEDYRHVDSLARQNYYFFTCKDDGLFLRK
jgi:hypothetical protein